jgi:hypothetical protein
MTLYDAENAPTIRRRLQEELKMGNENAYFKVDIGDTKARSGGMFGTEIDYLVVHVETLEQVMAFWKTTHLVVTLQTKDGESFSQATIPNFFWEVVVNPNGAPNSKDQLTGDPVRPTESKPFNAGTWQTGTATFQEGESSSMTTLTKALVLAQLKFSEDAISMFVDQLRMVTGMQRFTIVWKENRTMMVSALREQLGGMYPDLTAEQCSAEPAIALHDLMHKQHLRIQWHATRWQSQSESSNTNQVSPFGDKGVLARLMKAVHRAYCKTDNDGRAIPHNKARRMAALMTRVAAIGRVITYFDMNSDSLFDLPAALRGTKGGVAMLAQKICDATRLEGDPGMFRPSQSPVVKMTRPKAKELTPATPKAGAKVVAAGATAVGKTGAAMTSEWDKDGVLLKQADNAVDKEVAAMPGRLLSRHASRVVKNSDLKDLLLAQLSTTLKALGCQFHSINSVKEDSLLHRSRVGGVMKNVHRKMALRGLMANRTKHMASAVSKIVGDLNALDKLEEVVDGRGRKASPTKTAPPAAAKPAKKLPAQSDKVPPMQSDRRKKGSRSYRKGTKGAPDSRPLLRSQEGLELRAQRAKGSSEHTSRTSVLSEMKAARGEKLDEIEVETVHSLETDVNTGEVPLPPGLGDGDGDHWEGKASAATPFVDMEARISVFSGERRRAGGQSEEVEDRLCIVDGMRLEQVATALSLPFQAAVDLILKDERAGLLELVPSDAPLTAGAVDLHAGRLTAHLIRHSAGEVRLVGGTSAKEREGRPMAEQQRYEALAMCTVERALSKQVPMNGAKDRYDIVQLEADLQSGLFKIADADVISDDHVGAGGGPLNTEGLFAPPATAGCGGTMSASESAVQRMSSTLRDSPKPGRGKEGVLPTLTKKVVPVCGAFFAVEQLSLGHQLEGAKLPYDEGAAAAVALWLAICDSTDWKIDVLQLALRDEEYPRQALCERRLVEVLQRASTPRGMVPMTGGEFAGSTTQSGKLLWEMILECSSTLSTDDARASWACFRQGDALMQLTFTFDDEGTHSAARNADAGRMIKMIKLISRSLSPRQMLVVVVYIDGGRCEPHRAVMLVGLTEIIYYDPAGSQPSQARHHELRGKYIVGYLRRTLGSESDTSFSSVSGDDSACPQGADGACTFNCNGLGMVAALAACYVGMEKAMLVMRVLRRLGVEVMDKVVAVLPSAIIRLCEAHDPDFPPECSRWAPLGGWQPSLYKHYHQRKRFDHLVAPMLDMVMRVFRVPGQTDALVSLPPTELRRGTKAAGPEVGGTSGARAKAGAEVPHVLVMGEIGAGTGFNMQIASRALAAQGIKSQVGLSVEPVDKLRLAPRNRDDPLYKEACLVRMVEDLEASSDTVTAVQVISVSLPCAPNLQDLLRQFKGWSVSDSRVACMIAMAGLAACGQKALIKIENAEGFVDSLVCRLIRDMVSASGGGSFIWVGYGSHQRYPVNGNRAQLLLANAESKHLLPEIEAGLIAGAPATRLVLADILRQKGNSRPVGSHLVLVKDKQRREGSHDGPTRIGVVRGDDGAFEGVAFSADAVTAVAARGRVARSSLKALGAYLLDGQLLEFTIAGYCALVGVELKYVAHLSEEDAFRSIGGIASVGIERRVWQVVSLSMKKHPAAWKRAYAMSPLPPNHPMAMVVQSCASSFVGSPFLRVLHWKGSVALAPVTSVVKLPHLRMMVLGEMPPVGLVHVLSEADLMQVVKWVPVRTGANSSSSVEDCICVPSLAAMDLLHEVSRISGVSSPRAATLDELTADSPPVDVIVWQVRSAAQVSVPMARHLMLNRCGALFRIRLLLAEGVEKLLVELHAIAKVARVRVRCEAGDSARHGDPISASESRMITMMFMPLFCAQELGNQNMVAGDRGTAFHCAQGDTHNLLISYVVSIGRILKSLPGSSVNGRFSKTGLPKSDLPSVLNRYRATFRMAANGAMVLPINSTFPHHQAMADVVIGDDRVELKNGETLLRHLLDEEMAAALGFSAQVKDLLLGAALSKSDFQQLVYETEPYHSLTAQVVMMYMFILPMLGKHACELVYSHMQWKELGRSTRGAKSEAPVEVDVVPAGADSRAMRSGKATTDHDVTFELNGRQVTVPKGTVVSTASRRSCKPSEAIEQMETRPNVTSLRQGVSVRTASSGAMNFRWQ